MSDADLILSKVAVTRFSPDLAGVMSAVSNSLGLLGEFGGADAETLALATNNAEILLARLRFFRAAFGNDGPLTDLSGTRQLFEGWLKSVENRSTRFECVWDADDELPLFSFRLILLAGQIVAESLIRGGKITITAKAGAKRIVVAGTGQSVKTEPNLSAVLDGQDDGLTPKMTAAVFIRGMIKEQKLTCGINRTDDGFSLTFDAG